jgi:hypothetical protein
MAERSADVRAADPSPLRLWINRHPIATFLVLVYATTTALIFVPRVLTEPGVLPGGATPHGCSRTSSGRRCRPLSLPPL